MLNMPRLNRVVSCLILGTSILILAVDHLPPRVQYFILAVHDTSNGQLFLSFLNTWVHFRIILRRAYIVFTSSISPSHSLTCLVSPL